MIIGGVIGLAVLMIMIFTVVWFILVHKWTDVSIEYVKSFQDQVKRQSYSPVVT